MANGKAKGSAWEREIAKALTMWVTGKEKPYVFWRSPSSGALATISQSLDTSGDIIAIRPEGKFLTDIYSIEAKNGYPAASFDKHLKKTKNNDIESFWKQCVSDAEKAGKMPMLIFKKKGCQPIVGIIADVGNLKYISLKFITLPTVRFYDFYNFLESVKPENIGSI